MSNVERLHEIKEIAKMIVDIGPHDSALLQEIVNIAQDMTDTYDLNRFAKDMREISRRNGFENPQSIDEVERTATKLLLINEEVLEAWREVRKTGDLDAFSEELADTIIRVADLTVDLGIDLDAVVDAKVEKNRNRPYKHGAKV